MISIKKNLVFNYIGSFGVTIIQLVSVPLYLKYLGSSAYGIVGFYATLQAVFSIFDLGLSSTFNREMARLSAQEKDKNYIHNLLRTFEVVYWLIALFLGLLTIFASSFIAERWINNNFLAPLVITKCVMLMGFLFIFRWPIALYSGGLIGLQRQVEYNIINTIIETLKAFGAILVLHFISNDIVSFFIWQILITILSVAAFAIVLRKLLPKKEGKPQFKKYILNDVSRFALGMTGISLVSLILTQADKIILIKFIPISLFGFYTIASLVASSLSKLSSPIGQTFYPRLVQLVEIGDDLNLKKLYHEACQLISVFIIPSSLTICFFSKEILFLWTQNKEVSENAGPILSVLIIGSLANSLSSVPYLLQIAYGWTKLTLIQNIILITILVPLLLVIVPKYGSFGAAFFWMIINLGILFIGVNVMFRKILTSERKEWLFSDVIKPVVLILPIISIFKFSLQFFVGTSQIFIFSFIVVVFLVSFLAAILCFNYTRILISNLLKKIIYGAE